MNWAATLLLLALAATGGVASAQDSMGQLRSCLQRQHAERLECLDKLTRTVAPQHRQSPEDGWVVSQTTSPIDYSPIATATTSSRSGAGESAMQLSIRCRNGRTELVLTGPGISRGGGDDAIFYRINDNPAMQIGAAVPAFGPGVAFTGEIIRLVQSLPDSGDLIVLFSRRGGAAHDGSFSLAGLDEARAKIAAACKWPRALATPSH
ncbi:hypothetical protein ACVIW2_002413 [Bradyrhizobium huanghuaihaiense]|uniref:Type VI secretion system protein VasI n=1 Tax=Bradyrhizobium huanghuaihaiense TaxID=990078 RepID=A0A562R8D5_9BRAD|nr:hypothetical protein [Bradyrhizobium huanghuaihaiense]TWI64690.1 hypothetical protein IQ16_05749 [Bradyrhizobium huanghuaihaiense]